MADLQAGLFDDVNDTQQDTSADYTQDDTQFQSDYNPYNDLFMADNEPDQTDQQPQSTDTPEPQNGTQDSGAMDNDEKRYQYWQSQYDKMRKEHEQFLPLINVVKENPDLIDAIQEKYIEKMKGSPAPEKAPEPDLFQLPQKPQKPQDYNEVDAYQDPESASWKYRRELEDYRDTVTEMNLKVEQRRVEQERQAQLQYQMQMERQQKLAQTAQILRVQYQMSDDEIRRFMDKMSRPEAVNMDNLVKLFRLESEQNQKQTRESLKQKMQNLNLPRPGGMAPQGTQGGFNPDQAFNQTFFFNHKKK